MDDRNHSNNINRNTSNIFNHIKNRAIKNNLVTPEIFVSEIWMQDDHTNGVEIIELNSSHSEAGVPQTKNNFSQAWSFVNNDLFRNTDEDYRINYRARERRRMINEDLCVYPSEYSCDTGVLSNFSELHYLDDSNTEIAHSHQMNCFTILNNHIINSDSSSENDCARVEEIEPFCAESKKYWDHVYNEELTNCDSTNEKRTVWIYSFKNQRRLSENDFTLVSINSRDSNETVSTRSSLSDDDCINDKSSHMFRIASPIPATFIPRLDLSLAQTLSTVTEVSELKQSDASNESLVFKPINNWFTERNTMKSKKNIPNVINWMALSPRERRRRFKSTNSFTIDHKDQQSRRETFTFAEGIEPKKGSHKDVSSAIQVEVEVHVNNTQTDESEDTNSMDGIGIEPMVEKKQVTNTFSINISYADADTEINADNEGVKFDPCSTPAIQLNTNKTYTILTEPIEKLNSSKWIIGDESIEEEEEETAAFDHVFEVTVENDNEKTAGLSNVCDSVDKRLWTRQMKLMKSPIWTEYLPITESPLHLSLSLSSIVEKRSWFKRIGNCFPCWK